MSAYVFDQAWQQEHDRLRAVEDLFDHASTRHLADLGAGSGWRCLEVGCGAGGVARWLAERVGCDGHVLATDLDPRFLAESGRGNLDVRRHDITTDPLEENAFDLAHARLVLEHLPERRSALARMVAAVRPGGWVVIETLDFAGPMGAALTRYVHPPEHAALYERVGRALDALFTTFGMDTGFASRSPRVLSEAGLEQVGAEVHAPLVHGGAPRDFTRMTLAHLRGRLVGAGLISNEDVERFLALSTQPSAHYLPGFMVTTWGRRPCQG